MSSPSHRTRSPAFWATLLVGITIGLVAMALVTWRHVRSDQPVPSAQAQPPPTATGSGSAAGPGPGPTPAQGLLPVEQRTIALFREASPAVVNITTMAVETDRFRRNVSAIPRGSGSGVVWDRQGHVVTNFHVIAEGNLARVALDDGTVWEAKLVGTSPEKDLAVLRIDAPQDKLRPLRVGTSHGLAVGQIVLAIGNPFGLDHTLSTGVISALGREIKSLTRHPIQGVIQTDAAINPGNSGGPLLDSSGRLIGINTAIYSPTGAYAGIGFAVPVDTVERIVKQLIAHGRVIRPGLGIQIAEDDIARRVGIQGVLVLEVVKGSPAADAGLRPTRRNRRTGAVVLGDVIVAMDGKPIKDNTDLYRLLDQKQVGDEVSLTVLRDQQRVQVGVTLAPLPE